MIDANDDEHLNRVVAEVLGDVEVWTAGEGPEGPWYFRSLTIRRQGNIIRVYDVDEEPAGTYNVPDMSDLTDEQAHTLLRQKFEEIHQETLDQL